MNSEEQAIIKEAQRGNVMAFETLIKRYDRQVLQLALSMVSNAEDAQDIYQEVFVRVYKNLRRFQFKSEFSTWLYRVVVNYCINYQKKRKRQRLFSLEQMDAGKGENSYKAQLPGSERDPEAHVLNTELSGKIDAAIEQLSAKQQMVFVLRHYHGYKLKDIAEMMGCSLGTVKNYLFRATRRMQELLNEYSIR